jgi:uncharacterized protein YijF (DUF1287 family)
MRSLLLSFLILCAGRPCLSSSLLKIKVWKQERLLFLYKGQTIAGKYRIGLGTNPKDDKARLGDGCTPCGRFYICEMLKRPVPAERYGARSMRISYPGIEDARRGLATGLISKKAYIKIVRAVRAGRMPPQNTRLGGSIRIHGGGSQSDWTLGCMAMEDSDIVELFSKVSMNCPIEIYPSGKKDSLWNRKGFMNSAVLAGAKRVLASGCRYTKSAISVIPMKYPMGDIPDSIGVCTDVIIRALRFAGVDLQALMYEDVAGFPKAYPGIKRANPNIDHRRTRNLEVLFGRCAERLTNLPPSRAPEKWRPGDIVLMDTGVENGTIFDHIGIVSDNKKEGVPLVVNLWTIGHRVAEMELLSGDYPEIVGHFRLKHPWNYDASPGAF